MRILSRASQRPGSKKCLNQYDSRHAQETMRRILVVLLTVLAFTVIIGGGWLFTSKGLHDGYAYQILIGAILVTARGLRYPLAFYFPAPRDRRDPTQIRALPSVAAMLGAKRIPTSAGVRSGAMRGQTDHPRP